MRSLVVATLLFIAPRSADAAPIGAACRATSECDADARCVANVCRDPASAAIVVASTPHEESFTPWFHGAHGYLGATLGFGPTAPTGGAAQVALRGGLIWKGLQLLFEVSPGSTVYAGIAQAPFGGFEVTGSIGGMIPISRTLAWILRLGGGAGFLYGDGCCRYGVELQRTPAFGQLRADLVAFAVRASEHLLVEFALPSFRLDAGRYLSGGEFMGQWLTTVSGEYVF